MMQLRTLFIFALLACSGMAGRVVTKVHSQNAQNARARTSNFAASGTGLVARSQGALLRFPTVFERDYRMDQYLGHGSFGESWLVTDIKSGSPSRRQQMVMKLLYIQQGRRHEYLTWQMADRNSMLKKEVMSAVKECDISKYMYEEGLKSDLPGGQRVMNCFGHNAPIINGKPVRRRAGEMRQPLYLLLENCGDQDLTKFMAHMEANGHLSLKLVQNLFKQVMEGLQFMAALPQPWIHHDLKPDNIVVKTQKDGTYSVHLIDFGAAVKGISTEQRKMTAATGYFAPPEWGNGHNFAICSSRNESFRGSCGVAFDTYSTGAVLVQMLMGKYLGELDGCAGERGLDHRAIEYMMKDPRSARTKMTRAARGGYARMNRDFHDGPLGKVTVPSIAAMLDRQAHLRPTAEQVLRTSFCAVSVPNDLDYQAARAVARSARHEEKHRFAVDDKVQVFSVSGRDWFDGKILEVKTKGSVIVGYYKTGDHREWTNLSSISEEIMLDEDGQHIRPLVPEGDFMKQTFVPASAHHAAREEEDADDEEDKAACSDDCDQCAIAMDGSGRRKTYMLRWAAYCYILASRGKEQVTGQKCKSSHTEEVINQKAYYKFICTDNDLLSLLVVRVGGENLEIKK